ncbi:hypothetical protein TeGR_g10240 [Tetraparma gracilis]|uniref:Enkurin domain-containing protein n=1 Tax=Tetraparma gracilis TaxID=2962635 RepID=A0ABQ6N804_9STRA|nr:hypothetical protein TeGR_g10240 [Tetraparma gracilis]
MSCACCSPSGLSPSPSLFYSSSRFHLHAVPGAAPGAASPFPLFDRALLLDHIHAEHEGVKAVVAATYVVSLKHMVKEMPLLFAPSAEELLPAPDAVSPLLGSHVAPAKEPPARPEGPAVPTLLLHGEHELKSRTTRTPAAGGGERQRHYQYQLVGENRRGGGVKWWEFGHMQVANSLFLTQVAPSAALEAAGAAVLDGVGEENALLEELPPEVHAGGPAVLHGTTATIGGGINHIKKGHVLSSTFGPASQAGPSSPQNYLKKGSRTQGRLHTNPGKYTRPREDEKKETVPRRDEKPVMGLRTNKNFITANAVEAILSVPQMPRNAKVDYLGKEDYGKVPDYLGNVKEEIRRENDMIDEYVSRQLSTGEDAPEEFDEMDEAEREALVNKLKTKWDAVNQKYQLASHRVNFTSFGDIAKKEGQEAELKQLENDIMMLQRAGSVMISEY